MLKVFRTKSESESLQMIIRELLDIASIKTFVALISLSRLLYHSVFSYGLDGAVISDDRERCECIAKVD